MKIDDGGMKAASCQHTVDLPSKSPVPQQNNRIFLMDFVVRTALVFFGYTARGNHLIVQDEQCRRQQHG